MTLNALTDIEFVRMADGRSTVRNVLRSAHDETVQLDYREPGYVVTSQLRLLTAVAAVALRHCDEGTKEVIKNGISETAIDRAIEDLAIATNPFDPDFPFLQRPALKPASEKDTSRRLGRNDQPVKKLSPAMPPDQAEEFWNLLTKTNGDLSLPDAVLALTIYHHMSMAGNNAYDGDKCQMGSPAMRYVGTDLTATEVFFTGPRLLDTLLGLIPRSWVEGQGLPAWADRSCAQSLDEVRGQAHPLWAATWSSNTPACYWEGTRLTGVRTGGIPENWYLKSEMGTTKATRKAWWDDRNTRDPFYLYIPNNDGDLKVQRLDFGVDGTNLAVEWAAKNKTEALLSRADNSVRGHPGRDSRVMFARHQISGTASSPNIRASELFSPSTDRWAFDLEDEVRTDIQTEADMVQRLNGALRSSFRRKTSAEKELLPVLDSLADRQDDASAAFWRAVTDTYVDIIAELRDYHMGTRSSDDPSAGYELPKKLKNQLFSTTLRAFDDTVAPHFLQEPALISLVRGVLERKVNRVLNRGNISEEKQ